MGKSPPKAGDGAAWPSTGFPSRKWRDTDERGLDDAPASAVRRDRPNRVRRGRDRGHVPGVGLSARTRLAPGPGQPGGLSQHNRDGPLRLAPDAQLFADGPGRHRCRARPMEDGYAAAPCRHGIRCSGWRGISAFELHHGRTNGTPTTWHGTIHALAFLLLVFAT